jgi:NADH-quinone oxidoreductase subunit E
MLSDELISKINKEKTKYPIARAAVKSALRYAQEEHGWISEEVVRDVAEVLNLETIQVFEIATFYDLFYTEPVGKYQLRVCTNVSCMLRDSDSVVSHIQKKLDIKTGETTADGKFTLFEVECLGACGGAPMMMVGNEFYENLEPDTIDSIIEKLGASE